MVTWQPPSRQGQTFSKVLFFIKVNVSLQFQLYLRFSFNIGDKSDERIPNFSWIDKFCYKCNDLLQKFAQLPEDYLSGKYLGVQPCATMALSFFEKVAYRFFAIHSRLSFSFIVYLFFVLHFSCIFLFMFIFFRFVLLVLIVGFWYCHRLFHSFALNVVAGRGFFNWTNDDGCTDTLLSESEFFSYLLKKSDASHN